MGVFTAPTCGGHLGAVWIFLAGMTRPKLDSGFG
jgi:hypothetical protein